MAYIICEPCVGTKDTACVDVCPVDCIHWVDYTELKTLEEERQYQVIPLIGFPIDYALVRQKVKQKKLRKKQGTSDNSLIP